MYLFELERPGKTNPIKMKIYAADREELNLIVDKLIGEKSGKEDDLDIISVEEIIVPVVSFPAPAPSNV